MSVTDNPRPPHDFDSQRQGKCVPCGIRYVWPTRGVVRVALREAHCPRCGARLQQTVYFSRLPEVVVEDPTILKPGGGAT